MNAVQIERVTAMVVSRGTYFVDALAHGHGDAGGSFLPEVVVVEVDLVGGGVGDGVVAGAWDDIFVFC